jgi:hypothetical protein
MRCLQHKELVGKLSVSLFASFSETAVTLRSRRRHLHQPFLAYLRLMLAAHLVYRRGGWRLGHAPSLTITEYVRVALENGHNMLEADLVVLDRC